MTKLRVRATGSGRVVSWRQFKRGYLVDQSRISLTPTTVLTDVITDLYEQCRSLDVNCLLEVLSPNTSRKASFDMAIVGSGFRVTCGRRLVRGWFPLNPLAAEFGSNYDVLVDIEANAPVESRLLNELRSKYTCSALPDAESA